MDKRHVDRLARVGDSAERLGRLQRLVAEDCPEAELVLRNELRILWGRALSLWVRLRWPGLLARWDTLRDGRQDDDTR